MKRNQMRALATYIILLTASAIPLAAAPESKTEGPTVVGLSGRWTIDDGKTIGQQQEVHFGQTVAKGTKLTGHKGDHIVIQCEGTFDNQGCPSKDCEVEVCAKPGAGAGKERFRWLTSSSTLISRNPDRFITAVTRGLGPEPWEAVVEMNADKLNLAPVLGPLPEGRYRLKIMNLARDPRFVAEHAIKWSPGGAAEFAVSGIKPGVYSMVVMEGPGDDVQGLEAWLLVAAGPTAPSLLQTWEQVRDSVASWRDDVEPPYLHAFLRATLVSLFESTPSFAAGR